MILIHEPARPEPRTTWHNVLSFNQGSNTYLRTLQKGSQVYVEASYELREPDPSADPDTPAGQRQIFLRHGEFMFHLTTAHDSRISQRR